LVLALLLTIPDRNLQLEALKANNYGAGPSIAEPPINQTPVMFNNNSYLLQALSPPVPFQCAPHGFGNHSSGSDHDNGNVQVLHSTTSKADSSNIGDLSGLAVDAQAHVASESSTKVFESSISNLPPPSYLNQVIGSRLNSQTCPNESASSCSGITGTNNYLGQPEFDTKSSRFASLSELSYENFVQTVADHSSPQAHRREYHDFVNAGANQRDKYLRIAGQDFIRNLRSGHADTAPSRVMDVNSISNKHEYMLGDDVKQWLRHKENKYHPTKDIGKLGEVVPRDGMFVETNTEIAVNTTQFASEAQEHFISHKRKGTNLDDDWMTRSIPLRKPLSNETMSVDSIDEAWNRYEQGNASVIVSTPDSTPPPEHSFQQLADIIRFDTNDSLLGMLNSPSDNHSFTTLLAKAAEEVDSQDDSQDEVMFVPTSHTPPSMRSRGDSTGTGTGMELKPDTDSIFKGKVVNAMSGSCEDYKLTGYKFVSRGDTTEKVDMPHSSPASISTMRVVHLPARQEEDSFHQAVNPGTPQRSTDAHDLSFRQSPSPIKPLPLKDQIPFPIWTNGFAVCRGRPFGCNSRYKTSRHLDAHEHKCEKLPSCRKCGHKFLTVQSCWDHEHSCKGQRSPSLAIKQDHSATKTNHGNSGSSATSPAMTQNLADIPSPAYDPTSLPPTFVDKEGVLRMPCRGCGKSYKTGRTLHNFLEHEKKCQSVHDMVKSETHGPESTDPFIDAHLQLRSTKSRMTSRDSLTNMDMNAPRNLNTMDHAQVSVEDASDISDAGGKPRRTSGRSKYNGSSFS
jgi:hypothetical protein